MKILKELSQLGSPSDRLLIKAKINECRFLKPPLSEGVWGRL